MTDSSPRNELVVGDRVLVEADLDGGDAAYQTVIVTLHPNEIWLGLASPDPSLGALRPDQPVRLTVSRDHGALTGESRFLRTLDSSESRVFSVSGPGSLERVERRAKIRYEVNLPVELLHLNPADYERPGRSADAVTLNLGPAGTLLETDDPLGVGDELALAVSLPEEDAVGVIGVVMRVRLAAARQPDPNIWPRRVEAAIKFTRITGTHQARIARFILMSEYRRHEAEVGQREGTETSRQPRHGRAPGPMTGSKSRFW